MKNKITFFTKLKRFFSFKRLMISNKLVSRYGSTNLDYRKLPEGLTHHALQIVNIYKVLLYKPLAKCKFNTKTKTLLISYVIDTNVNYMFITEEQIKLVTNDVTETLNITHGIYNYLMFLYINKENIEFIKIEKDINLISDNKIDKVLNDIK